MALVLRALVQLFWGTNNQVYEPGIRLPYVIGDIRIPPDNIVIVGGAILLVVAFHLFLQNTKIGKAMRAMSDNVELARISGIDSDVKLDDGSGSVEISSIGGSVEIDDGSGSLEVTDIGGDVSIEDGSGSITIRGVNGAVEVDDGSGDIDVKDAGSLVILDDGSGDVETADIRGKLQIDS